MQTAILRCKQQAAPDLVGSYLLIMQVLVRCSRGVRVRRSRITGVVLTHSGGAARYLFVAHCLLTRALSALVRSPLVGQERALLGLAWRLSAHYLSTYIIRLSL